MLCCYECGWCLAVFFLILIALLSQRPLLYFTSCNVLYQRCLSCYRYIELWNEIFGICWATLQLCHCFVSTFTTLDRCLPLAGFDRLACSEPEPVIILLFFLQHVGYIEPHPLWKFCEIRVKSVEWLFYWNPAPSLMDSCVWRHSGAIYLLQSRMTIIGNTYLPFRFNDAPPKVGWPRCKQVAIFISAKFSPPQRLNWWHCVGMYGAEQHRRETSVWVTGYYLCHFNHSKE